MADALKFDLLAKDRMTEVFERVAKATDKLDAHLEKLGKQSTKTGKDLDDAERGAKKLGDGMDDAGRKSHGFGEKLSGGLDGALTKIKGFAASGALAAGAAAVGIGVALGAGVVKAAQEAMSRQQDTATAIAQIGGSPEMAAEFGRIAGKLYAKGFGESFADNINAVKEVFRGNLIPEDADGGEIERITGKVQTLTKLLGAELPEVTRSVSQLLRTGLADSADEAIDVITRGMQQGADKAGDLLETLNEYPTQFRDLGLSAKQSMGIIVQGLRGGARDADVVADALKELNIRVQDGTAAKGLQKIGLNAKEMAKAFGEGGPKAAAALDRIFDKLRAVKDPQEQYILAQQILGTKSEDLAKALDSIDPSSAVSALGQVEGAADQAAKVMGDTAASKVERFKRSLENWAVDVIGGQVIPMVERLVGIGRRMADAFKESGVADELGRIWRTFSAEGGQETVNALEGLVGTIRDNKDEIRLFGEMAFAVFAALANGAIPATIRAIELFAQAIGTGMRALEFFKNVGFAVFDAILGYAVHAFGWIPGLGDRLRESKKDFDRWRDQVNNAIDGIKRDVTVQIRARITSSYSGGGSTGSRGLYVAAYASGGQAPGGVPIRVGEHGPETVVLPAGGGLVQTNGQTASLGGGDVITLRVIHETPDGRVIREELLAFKRRSGQPALGLA